jgi:hypothetical protein
LTGGDLAARLVARVPADRIHFIVDACGSYFLAYSRGPGGERRPIGAFVDPQPLVTDPRVGLLLSTSSARESHEWEGFQAGVFSHEVRSALLGAADADGDGRVSYREVAAFVQRANAAIPNERFRPDVHAHAPAASDTLVDLRQAHVRRLDIDGAHAGRYYVEDERGVRIADFHSDANGAVSLMLPAGTVRYFARRLDDDVEYAVPSSPDAIALADLTPSKPRSDSRGAAHEAFNLLFTLPFDRSVVVAYRPAPAPLEIATDTTEAPSNGSRTRRVVGWASLATGAAVLGFGATASIVASTIAGGARPSDSQADVARRNKQIVAWHDAAIWSVGGGAAAAIAGLVLLLWPDGASHVQVAPSAAGVVMGYGSTF